ncbi:MAG: PAS domain S-box protein, partial [Nitrospirota bacterium]
LLSAVLLQWGSFMFLGRTAPRWLAYAFASLALWIGAALALGAPFMALSLPTFLFMAAVYVWTGAVFLQSRGVLEGKAMAVPGVAFIAWGIHKADYPFLRPVDWFAPWGYAVGALLSFVVAISVVLVYLMRSREEAERARRNYRTLFESSNDAVYLIDPETRRLVDCNLKAAELDGYSREELKDMTVEALHPPAEREALPERFAAVAERGSLSGISGIHHLRKDGTLVPVEVSASMVEIGGRRLNLSSVRDVTKREEAERRLRESEEMYRSLMESANDAILAADSETGLIVDCNAAASELLGRPREEITGLHQSELHPQGEARDARVMFSEHAQRGRALEVHAVLRKDGARVPVEISASQVSVGGKRLLLGIFRDVTERLRAEEELRESRRSLYALMSNLPGMAYHCLNDRDWTMKFVSEGCLELTGYRPEELVESRAVAYGALIVPEDRGRVWEDVQAALGEERPFTISYKITTRQGELKWVWEKGSGVFSPEGEVLAIEGFMTDVTDRVRAGEKLRESEERFHLFMDNSPLVAFIKDPETRYLYVNRKFEEAFSVGREEVAGKRNEDLFPPDIARRMTGEDRAVIASGRPARYELAIPSNGKERFWDVFKFPISTPDGKPRFVCGLAEDVTERKEAGRRLGLQLRRLNSLRTIDLAISGSLDLKITLDILLAQVVSQLGVDAAAVMLLNHHTMELEYSAGRGLGSDSARSCRVRLGEGFPGQAALERRTVLVGDAGKEGGEGSCAAMIEKEGFVSYASLPLIARGQVKGTLNIFSRSTLEPDAEWLGFLETLAGQAAIAIDNSAMFGELQHSRDELATAYDATIEGWSRALDYRDQETEGHSKRVTDITVKIALRMGMSEEDLVHIRRGALLHDIGKLGVPDSILFKPGKLDEAEWKRMKRHPEMAHELLAPIPYLKRALTIPYCHHERWDGSGYPRGLKGEEIPLEARIFAVVDVWDALLSDRPYRPAWEPGRVSEYLSSVSGKELDPEVVGIFLEMWDGGEFVHPL